MSLVGTYIRRCGKRGTLQVRLVYVDEAGISVKKQEPFLVVAAVSR
jgi:hypothetical protein